MGFLELLESPLPHTSITRLKKLESIQWGKNIILQPFNNTDIGISKSFFMLYLLIKMDPFQFYIQDLRHFQSWNTKRFNLRTLQSFKKTLELIALSLGSSGLPMVVMIYVPLQGFFAEQITIMQVQCSHTEWLSLMLKWLLCLHVMVSSTLGLSRQDSERPLPETMDSTAS